MKMQTKNPLTVTLAATCLSLFAPAVSSETIEFEQKTRNTILFPEERPSCLKKNKVNEKPGAITAMQISWDSLSKIKAEFDLNEMEDEKENSFRKDAELINEIFNNIVSSNFEKTESLDVYMGKYVSEKINDLGSNFKVGEKIDFSDASVDEMTKARFFNGLLSWSALYGNEYNSVGRSLIFQGILDFAGLSDRQDPTSIRLRELLKRVTFYHPQGSVPDIQAFNDQDNGPVEQAGVTAKDISDALNCDNNSRKAGASN